MNILSRFKRPKRASGFKPGPVSPEAWNSVVDCIESLETAIRQICPASTPDIIAEIGAGGATFRLARHPSSSGSSVPTGPFCKKYLVPAEGETPAKLFLLGGLVSGGDGNETIADIELAEIGSEPTDGTHVWLQVEFTAYTEDGLLLPGGDLTAATEGSGATVPDNTMPTGAAPDGTLYISLGSWADGIFTPAACGNIQISHCLGSLTHNH